MNGFKLSFVGKLESQGAAKETGSGEIPKNVWWMKKPVKGEILLAFPLRHHPVSLSIISSSRLRLISVFRRLCLCPVINDSHLNIGVHCLISQPRNFGLTQQKRYRSLTQDNSLTL